MGNGFWQALLLTVQLAIVTTILLFVLGLPFAHWLNGRRGFFFTVLEAVVSLPIVLPPTVIGFYLLIVFAPGHFPGSFWQSIFGHPLPFSFAGLVAGSMIYSLPFAIQPFQAALRDVPSTILEAASLETTPWRVFWNIHLPMARRGILAGLTLVFAHTVGEFGVVLMIGGNIPGQTRVAAIALYDETQMLNFGVAHQYAAVLLIISLVLLVSIALIQRRLRILD